MTRFFSWLLVLMLLGAFTVAAIFVLRLRADAGKGMPDYSIYSEEANGLAEVARNVRRMGWQPVALTRLVNPAMHRGLLVMVEPVSPSLLPGSTNTLGESDAAAVLRWVRAGNTWVSCSRHNSACTHALDVA